MNGSIRAIRTIIRGNPSLVAALTVDGKLKVRPGSASQVDLRPYVLLWSISDRPVHDLQGLTGTRTALVQVDVYADGPGHAAAIAAVISSAIDAFGRGNADDVWVSSILEEDTRTNDQRTGDGADKPIAVVQTDYRLVYRDSSPPTLS